ncbi:MAG TPA: protein kinase [Kofleriaceae bacterium]|nr:protein kinase [Kofleriaceae bacterium]
MQDPGFAQGLVGITLDGRYRLDAVLGEGGMGAVFRATQLAMERKVAVKLLKPHLTSDEAALQRFAREARATLKVESPHAVKILDFGVTPLGDYYMVLEYLDGRTVQKELEIDGPFAPRRVAHIARQALHALGAAHRQGLIHRDVKPDNLLLMRSGSDPDYTKILDFGVAKLMQGAAGDPAQLALTAAGMVFGTPEFMSPEQACGHALDGRSDLYSLAVTMFVMLTGTGLFEARSAIEWLTHHAQTPAPRLATVRAELAAYPELDELLQRCLAKHREQRPESAEAMAEQIARIEPALARSGSHSAIHSAIRSGPSTNGHAAAHVTGEIAAAPGGLAVAARPVDDAIAHAVTPSAPRLSKFRESSYFHALRPADLPAPPAGATLAALGAADTLGVAVPPGRSRRGLYLWLGGAAVASLVGVAIGVAIRRSAAPASAGEPPALRVVSSPPTDAGPRDAPGARPDPAASDEARAPAAPAPRTAPDGVAAFPSPSSGATASGTASGRQVAHVVTVRAASAPHSAEAEEHLRNAEDAFAHQNQLRQLAEADLALRADPTSVRARFLLGDALIRAGDLDRGCAYLRAVKRNVQARNRARSAGCPDD